MKGILYLLSLSAVALTSCTSQCNIAGNSSIGGLDGQMLYLRVTQDGATVCYQDSCEVIHGRFNFYSELDSTLVAQLYMGDERLMPVVLENGNLDVRVDHSGQSVKGGPYNDRLYRFMQKKNRLENEQWELDRKCMRMMREGRSAEEIQREIAPRAAKLTKQVEDLETKFIRDNFDNPLGPGCFMLLFSHYPMPVMTEQIRDILDGAPASFLQHPFINSYMRRAAYPPPVTICTE